MKTKFYGKDEIAKKWILIDVKDQVVGRIATKIATILTGKDKRTFTPGVDCGDFVVVTNAALLKVTGNKLKQKAKFHHSGYPQGDKYETYEDLMKNNPEKLLRLAVRGMLPKTRIGDRLINHLKIFIDGKHNVTQKLEEVKGVKK